MCRRAIIRAPLAVVARRSGTIGVGRLGVTFVAVAQGVIFVAVPVPPARGVIFVAVRMLAGPAVIPVAALRDATFAAERAVAGKVADSATTAVATGATHVLRHLRASPITTARWQRPWPRR